MIHSLVGLVFIISFKSEKFKNNISQSKSELKQSRNLKQAKFDKNLE